MEKLANTLLYTIDKCFRSYHQFAQKNVKKAGYDITIDQWLILKSIHENPNFSQNDIGKILFKDNASITRIIQLLVKSGYITRSTHADDRRRVQLRLTEKGKTVTKDVHQIALDNRAKALKNVDPAHLQEIKAILEQIIQNCSTK